MLVVSVDPGVNLPTGWGTLLTNFSSSSFLFTKAAGSTFAVPVPLNRTDHQRPATHGHVQVGVLLMSQRAIGRLRERQEARE